MKINVTKPSLPPFDEYCDIIESIWKNSQLTNNGPILQNFKDLLLKYLGANYLSLFVNGHSALEAAIEAFDFPPGSEIITTPFTFASTTNAIVRKGMKPVFCDINKEDLTIDSSKITSLITKKTVAILGVHVFGNLCDFSEIEKISKKYHLVVIYDAAHAFGVKYKNSSIFAYGDISMLSFHATKVFNTIEGGALCYRDETLQKKFDLITNFGLSGEQCDYCGGNFKMNEFQAAMGICNLNHIDLYIDKRKKVFERYIKNLGNIKGITIVKPKKECFHNYSYLPIIVHKYKKNRDEIIKELEQSGIGARKYFYPATNEFSYLGEKNLTPVAHFISNHIITLPMYDSLPLEKVDLICKIIKR